MTPRLRAAALVAVLAVIPVSAAYYARSVDATELGVDECLDGGDLCVGEPVGWGFGRILRADGDDVVMTLRGGREVALVDWDDRPHLPVGLVVSIAGTYEGHATLSVDRHQLHPLRRIKEVVGLLGLGGWLLAVGVFLRGRMREP